MLWRLIERVSPCHEQFPRILIGAVDDILYLLVCKRARRADVTRKRVADGASYVVPKLILERFDGPQICGDLQAIGSDVLQQPPLDRVRDEHEKDVAHLIRCECRRVDHIEVFEIRNGLEPRVARYSLIDRSTVPADDLRKTAENFLKRAPDEVAEIEAPKGRVDAVAVEITKDSENPARRTS